MTESGQSGRVRRVLVALDASPGSLAAAGAAARAAALLRAELVGLFVEDLELLALSRSPLAHRIGALSSNIARVERRDLEQEMEVQARRARRALVRAAGRLGVTCEFRVVRGAVAEKIATEARSSDIVSLGRAGWTLRSRRTLGRTARALLAEPGRRALFVERRDEIHPPLVVVHDGSKAGLEALDQAVELAGSDEAALVVLLAGPDPSRLRAQAEERLGAIAPGVRFHDLPAGPGTEAIVRVAERVNAGLLLLSLAGDPAGQARLVTLLDRLSCPVLVIS